jgi:hypothetical protein
VQKGLRPLPFALFFASTALAQILLSVLNADRRPAAGFSRALTVGVFALDTRCLTPNCTVFARSALQLTAPATRTR